MLILTGNESELSVLERRLKKQGRWSHQEIRADLLPTITDQLFTMMSPFHHLLFTYKKPAPDIYAKAKEAGAEYLDMDYRFPRELMEKFEQSGLIVSAHLFTYDPDSWPLLWSQLQQCPGQILKMAVMVEDAADIISLKKLVADSRRPVILVAMGLAGIISRYFFAECGSIATFVCENGAAASAPGQITVDELNFLEHSKNKGFFALFGGLQIEHSPGPKFYQKYFPYLPIVTTNLPKVLPFLAELGLLGASVTMPNKMAAYEMCHTRTRAAELAGAVNTLIYDGNYWYGDNSDYLAMETIIASLSSADQEKVAHVLGAGGAARAIALALTSGGYRVFYYSRRPNEEMAGTWVAWADLDKNSAATMLVNATPLGYLGEDIPIVPNNYRLVVDLVMSQAETPLIAAARKAGCKNITGFEFWQEQAKRQLELFSTNYVGGSCQLNHQQ